VDKEGNIIGQHMGYQFYTIGQRRGLGLNLGRPFFVSEIRTKTNEVVVGDFEELLIDEIEVINYKLYYEIEELLNKEITARPRFSSKGLKGKLILKDNSLHFKFNEKTHENSEGQHIVFYLENEIKMDILAKKVFLNEEEIALTKTEFLILEYFMKNKGLSCSREKIIIGVWGYDFDGEEKIVDVYINSLRKKIDSKSKYIHTIRGFGYIFQYKED